MGSGSDSYGGPAPTPSISISADNHTVSVVQGSTVTITYTLTRNGGYTGTVTPSVGSLPSGVSGSWSDSSLTSGETTTVLTLTATGGATVVGATSFTVTFSGSGVSDATDTGTVAVTSSGATLLFASNVDDGTLNFTQNGIKLSNDFYIDVATVSVFPGKTTAVRFNQGDANNASSFAELGFGDFPSNLTEVYCSYDMYYPNGSESPGVGPNWSVNTVSPGGTNDKFFRLWGDDYNSSVSKVGASTFAKGDGTSRLLPEFRYNDGSSLWGIGQGNSPVSANPDPFLGDAAYKGRVIPIKWRCKVASAANNDGIIQIWVDGTLVIDAHALANYPPGGSLNYYQRGYIIGANNTGFMQTGQVMYLQNFRLSTGGFA
jgi:hypothetical protein